MKRIHTYSPTRADRKVIALLASGALFLIYYLLLLTVTYFVVEKQLEETQDEPAVLAVDTQAVAPSHVESLVNSERGTAGGRPLSTNSKLRTSACAKADDMLAGDYWDHVSPTGATPWVFIDAAGYEYKAAGENLAKGFSDDSALVQAWMDSPSHRRNLLNEHFTEQGICEREGMLQGQETRLVVQQLGARS